MCLDEINGLMAGYALSALDADELKKFEGHLATCPDCRAGVAEMQPLIDALSMMNKKCVPSDALRERVMESARAEPKIASYFADLWRRPSSGRYASPLSSQS